ncbi:MAG: hypothetical protein K2R98_29030 [Gemmataceae bacterium]|nr:hypothetical protein [Gemmataceae bacterium]
MTTLDRAVLVGTVQRSDLAFFEEGDGANETAAKKKVKETPTKGSKAELEELLSYCNERCREFIRSCATKSLPLPVVGYELADEEGPVSADAELAWSSQRVVVLLPERMDGSATAFQGAGWPGAVAPIQDTCLASASRTMRMNLSTCGG